MKPIDPVAAQRERRKRRQRIALHDGIRFSRCLPQGVKWQHLREPKGGCDPKRGIITTTVTIPLRRCGRIVGIKLPKNWGKVDGVNF